MQLWTTFQVDCASAIPQQHCPHALETPDPPIYSSGKLSPAIGGSACSEVLTHPPPGLLVALEQFKMFPSGYDPQDLAS
jgi:hypothetical protein